MARHPGTSFPVNLPQEAVPNQPMTDCPPPCHGPPFFKTLINRGLAGGTIFSMCTRARYQEYAMMF